MGQGAAASSRGRGLADRRAPRVGREEILSRQLGRRNGPPQLSCDDQGTMDLRAGPSTVEGGTRARPLRGKVLARPSSSCADGDDCLRVPPTSPAQNSEAGKKESTARPLNRRCRRFATPSSTSSCDQVLSDVRTADPGSARKSSVSKSAKVVLASAIGPARHMTISPRCSSGVRSTLRGALPKASSSAAFLELVAFQYGPFPVSLRTNTGSTL